MTPQDVMDMVASQAHKDISTVGSDDEVDVSLWTQRSIRYVQAVDDWECHKDGFELSASTTPALTAGTYEYAMRTLKSDWRKPVFDSMRYGSHPLEWKESIEELDRVQGLDWSDSSVANGTPTLVTMMGGNLILCPKPSASFAAGQTVAGRYYRAEDLTSSSWKDEELLFYEDFFPALVDVALIYSLQQEDDTNFRAQLEYWVRQGLPELRSFTEGARSADPLERPQWGRSGGRLVR